MSDLIKVLLFDWMGAVHWRKGLNMKFKLQFVDIIFIVVYSTLLLLFCNFIILSKLEIFLKVCSKWF
jgi:hypothetical protein